MLEIRIFETTVQDPDTGRQWPIHAVSIDGKRVFGSSEPPTRQDIQELIAGHRSDVKRYREKLVSTNDIFNLG